MSTDKLSNAPAELRQRAEPDGRTVEIRIMPWDTVAETVDGRESFARGAFAGIDAKRVTIESQRHGGQLVGRGESLVEHDDAAYLHARISKTAAGDELLTLIDDGVLSEASVAFLPVKTARKGGVLVRQAVDLRRVAILERGNFPGAGVIAVRSEVEGSNVAIETPTNGEPAADADRMILPAVALLTERMERLDDRMVEIAARAAVPAPVNRPEAWKTRSLGEWLVTSFEVMHERTDPNEPSHFARAVADAYRERALVDQVTTNNPGLIPPAHLTEAVGILNHGRPTVEAFGGARALPANGMEIDWPELVPLAGRAIAEQATQKTEVVSRAISFARKSIAIKTYAGASDISIQLIRRSSPSYRELFARVMLAEYARVTEDAWQDAVLAAVGIQTIDYDVAADTDGAGFRAALFQASALIQRATGSPASVAVVSEDLFVKIGSFPLMVAPGAGPSNAVGSASARDLDVSVSGISIVLGGLDMPANTAIVSNRQAGGWFEEGPFSLEASDVARLGLNVAYYGFAAPVIQIPAGIVKITNVLP